MQTNEENSGICLLDFGLSKILGPNELCKDITRQTVQDEIPFKKNVWKTISKECINFIEGLIQKDPEKRMSVKDALEHEWIGKINVYGSV